jgi:hypothetical protein
VIVPVAFEVKRKNVEEDFDFSNRFGDIIAEPTPWDMRVTVKLYDTDTRRGLGFSGRLISDPEADPYSSMGTMFKFGGKAPDGSHAYLKQLRDEIDRLLEPRWAQREEN